MPSCKQVSELVNQSFDRSLTWRERWAVRVHVWYCVGCTRFATQLRALGTLMRAWEKRSQEDSDPASSLLSEEARARIARAVEEARLHRRVDE